MKDSGKIREKDPKGDVKIIFIIGAVFLVAFGLIVYGIVKLTNQYFSLKEQLSEKKAIESSQTTTPDNGKKITMNSDNIKVEELKKSAAEAISDNKPSKYAVEEKKTEPKTETKIEQKPPQPTEQKVEQKPEQKKPLEEKGKVVIDADKNVVKKEETKQTQPKKETSDNKTAAKPEEKPKPQPKETENKTAVKEKPKEQKQDKKENGKKEEVSKKQELAKKEEHKKEAELSSKGSGGNYSLQLMAFKDEEHTKKEAEKLRSKLKDVYVVKADLGEKGIWYRIRYGKNLTKEEALKLKEKLQKEHGINAILATN